MNIRISGRYVPFIVAPPVGFGGPLAHHYGPLAHSQQHIQILVYACHIRRGNFLNFLDRMLVARYVCLPWAKACMQKFKS